MAEESLEALLEGWAEVHYALWVNDMGHPIGYKLEMKAAEGFEDAIQRITKAVPHPKAIRHLAARLEAVAKKREQTNYLDSYLSGWSNPDEEQEARGNFRWNARRRLVDLICQRTPGLVGKRCISWIAQGLFERAISPAGPDSIFNKATTDSLEELLAPRDDWDTTWVCVINKIVQILRSDRVLIRELARDLFEMITDAPEDRYINRVPADPSSSSNEDGCEWDTPPHDPEIDLPWWF